MNKYALTVENLTKVYSDSKNKKENQKVVELNTHTGNTYNSVSDNLWPEDEEDY